MKVYYFLLACFLTGLTPAAFAQCPPTGFPQPGNTCPLAPILCENLDGYCATINNNNTTQTFPGCPGWQLNNDEWFAFFAGSTSITIQVTPSNCSSGGMQGLQGGIYDGCGPPWDDMDLQCSCTTNPFILTSNNFVIGQIYYFVLDGCAGNVCDYSIDVLSGSTVGVPPDDPGAISGPTNVCAGASTSFSISTVTAATIYNWTLNPASAGTVSANANNVTINWSNTASGSVELCVSVANLCYSNPDSSCLAIDVTPRPTAVISGSGNLCANTPGSVDLTVNFTGDAPWTFVYTINGVAQPPIQTSENPYTLQATQPGVYALQSVTSPAGSNNCPGTVSGSATITLTTLNSTTAVTNAQCGQSNGAINLTPAGGTTPYSFNWSNGETTEDLANIPPGTYTVTVTSANGCTQSVTATVQDNQITINISGTVVNNTTCTGGNGSITTTITPSGSYTFEWSNGLTNQNLNNLEPGSYTLTVTSGVNCTASMTFTVDDNPNEPNITFSTVQSTCDLSNGSINISVSGGVSPYRGNGSISISITPAGSYTIGWSNGATTTNIANLPPGTYTVTVSAGGSCTETAEFTIDDEPNEPNISFSVVQTTCDLSNGSINLSVSGGVPPYAFLWSNGALTEDLNNIPAGNYAVTVTGANGCSNSADITVDNNNPSININGNLAANTTCIGGNGSIALSVTPAGAYTYLWSTGAITPNIINLPPGTYTVTVSGGGSCTETAQFTIDDNPFVPNITFTFVETTCDLSNGSINAIVTGGVPPYTYLWSNNATTSGLNNIPAGNYAVTVTGANGCSHTADIDLPNNNPPINIGANIAVNTACLSGTGNGSISLFVTPAGAYTYVWSTGSTASSINNLAPGIYEVTVSGGGSCTETASFVVPDDPNVPELSFSQTDPTCGLSNGSINLTVVGGVAPYTYTWSGGQTTQDINNLPPDIYIVTVTGANGCSAIDGVVLSNMDIPVSVSGDVTQKTSCVTNNGSITLALDPPNLTINWSNGSHQPVLNNLAPGVYTVTVSAGGSCTETAEFTIFDASEPPILLAEITSATCGFSNGAIDLEAYAGIDPYTYHWSNNAATQDLNNLPAGSYAVTVTSAVGCTATPCRCARRNDYDRNIRHRFG
ncbi:MAG: hypothetical protein IPH12_20965 [Saprospirales bacterium]|nr:hypothetical protein [Saprospirales bacterium]